MSIAEAVKEALPTLSASSIRTYSSVLGSLYKKVFGVTGEVNLKHFEEDERIIHFLRDKPASARKSTLAALVVLTGNDAYRKAMTADIQTYNETISKQVATPAQKAAEISAEEIRHIYDRPSTEATTLYTKKHQTVSDLLTIQDSVILALLGGVFIAPRRSLDFTAFKVRNIGATDNHLLKNELVFLTYKTASTYGKQTVTIPKELLAIMKRWFKVNPTEWLLFDSHFKPLTSVTLNQRLNRIFGGRKISINALRHSYLTSRFTEYSKEQKEVQKTMTDMGSSPAVLNNYVKLS